MKKVFFPVISVFILLSACSAPQNGSNQASQSNTLKTLVKTKEESAVWTRELESVRLTKSLKQTESVSDSISLSPDVLKVSSVQSPYVYPRLDDFGSLDVTELPDAAWNKLCSFCDAVSKDLYSAESLFKRENLFSFVFFADDLKNKFFDGELPASDEENTDLFTDYIPGKPFISGDDFQVPVRFFLNKDFFDSMIYISADGSKVTQIKILKIEKSSGARK